MTKTDIEWLEYANQFHYDNHPEINTAVKHAIEALERTRWIPVSERLPEFYQKVLIIDETKTLNITRLCHSSDWELYGITHWIPLPEPPKEVE